MDNLQYLEPVKEQEPSSRADDAEACLSLEALLLFCHERPEHDSCSRIPEPRWRCDSPPLLRSDCDAWRSPLAPRGTQVPDIVPDEQCRDWDSLQELCDPSRRC